MSKPERNYCVTDHEGQLARWLEELQEFDFEILHRLGRRHGNADALYRIPCHQCGRNNKVTHVSAIDSASISSLLSQRSPDDKRLLQLQDESIKSVLIAKESDDERPSLDKEMSRVKRYNRTLVNMLASCAEEHPFNWEEYVHKMCMAYNSSVQSTTGYSPFFLMFSHKPRLPVDIMFDTEKVDRIFLSMWLH